MRILQHDHQHWKLRHDTVTYDALFQFNTDILAFIVDKFLHDMFIDDRFTQDILEIFNCEILYVTL